MVEQARKGRGAPNVASILSWIVPGAGLIYLGAPGLGACAFVLVECLYWLGLQLSDGMLFELLQADLRVPFAGALTPEVGNLSGLVYHMKVYGFGAPSPRPWPEWMELGVWCTAVAGMLNAMFMVHAHYLAHVPHDMRSRERSPALFLTAAWLVPGLGHILQGRRARGLVVGACLIGMFLLGTWLTEGANLDRERHFYYWAGQFLAGAPVMVLEALHGHAAVTGEIPYGDAGLTLACLAGLLNVLAMLDVHTVAERRALAALESTREAVVAAPLDSATTTSPVRTEAGNA